MASGLENITKLAKEIPNILPVYSNTSLATSSPAVAASNTALESILSIGMFLSVLGLSVVFKISTAEVATPVADA